jgi:hypothetical protein
MGQLDSTCTAPPSASAARSRWPAGQSPFATRRASSGRPRRGRASGRSRPSRVAPSRRARCETRTPSRCTCSSGTPLARRARRCRRVAAQVDFRKARFETRIDVQRAGIRVCETSRFEVAATFNKVPQLLPRLQATGQQSSTCTGPPPPSQQSHTPSLTCEAGSFLAWCPRLRQWNTPDRHADVPVLCSRGGLKVSCFQI